MIHDVSESVRALIKRDVIAGTDVEVVFDAPTKDWATRRNTPTVDVYFYDIREDVKRRTVGSSDARGANGFVSGRVPTPRWYKCSYLITAWTQRPEDEHRLLASLLACFLRFDKVPGDVLQGSLAEYTLPIPLSCGLPPPEDRSFSDVWSALGGELKPSLDLVITVPVDLGRLIAAGPPVLETPRFSVRKGDEAAEQVGGGAARPPRRRIGPDGEPGEEITEPVEETVFVGKDDQPGRIFKVRDLTT